MLAAGVDVQNNRLEAEVRGYGLGEESFGVEYRVLPGDPHQPAVWLKLRDWLAEPRKRSDGVTLHISCAGIDSGFATHQVYAFVQKHGLGKVSVFALKGQGGFGKPLVSASRRSGVKKVRLYTVGSDTMKSLIYSRLAVLEPGPGFYHFPDAQGYDGAYYAGLTAEVVVSKWSRGRTIKVFENPGKKPNEPLDTAQYSLAAVTILRPNFEKLADKLAKQKKDKAEPGAAAEGQEQAEPKAKPAEKPAVTRPPPSGWMRGLRW
jgi:phage terminase large subunit GpA-like protein